MQKLANYEGSLETKLIINKPSNEVYTALHDLSKWTIYLPHVEKIDILYDDGKYQEFIMHVISNNDTILKVRSVRKCNLVNHISYFQPEPPGFLLHHAGEWNINTLSPNETELIAKHFWNKNEAAARDDIEELLTSHANFAMSNWKQILESGQYK